MNSIFIKNFIRRPKQFQQLITKKYGQSLPKFHNIDFVVLICTYDYTKNTYIVYENYTRFQINTIRNHMVLLHILLLTFILSFH